MAVTNRNTSVKPGPLTGNMRSQIDIYNVTLTRDTLGGHSAAETLYMGGVWCVAENVWGKVYYLDKQRTYEVQYVFTIRYRLGITPNMVVYYNSKRTLIIKTVNLNDLNEWLEIHVSNYNSGGERG